MKWSHDCMIKILAAYELEKEHIHTQQQDPHPRDCPKNVGLYFKIILAYGYRFNAIIWFGIYPVDNEMNRNEMDEDEPEKRGDK